MADDQDLGSLDLAAAKFSQRFVCLFEPVHRHFGSQGNFSGDRNAFFDVGLREIPNRFDFAFLPQVLVIAQLQQRGCRCRPSESR